MSGLVLWFNRVSHFAQVSFSTKIILSLGATWKRKCTTDRFAYSIGGIGTLKFRWPQETRTTPSFCPSCAPRCATAPLPNKGTSAAMKPGRKLTKGQQRKSAKGGLSLLEFWLSSA